MVKEIKVFYDQNGLPYKDSELQVHFPVAGNSFQGASQTTQIKFYTDNILNDESAVWFAVSKLPNGQVGYTILTRGSDSDGTYYLLTLTEFHTQYKGDLYINLQAYAGGVEFEEDSDIFVPVGVPIVYVSGSIKLAINYATGIIDGGEVDIHTLQELVAYMQNYLRTDSGKYIKVVDNYLNINTNTYKEYLSSGDIIYSVSGGKFYVLSGTYPHLVATEITLHLSNVDISAMTVDDVIVGNEIRVEKGTSYLTFGENGLVSLKDYLDEKQNTIPVVTISPTHSGTISPSALLDSLAVFPSYLTYTDSGQSFIYEHCGTDSTYYYFRKLFKESVHDNTSYLIYGGDVYIQVNKSTGVYSQQGVQYNLYSKAQADTLLSAKADKSDTYTKQEIDTKLTSMLVYKGSKTVAELNALAPSLGETQTGWFYNVSDSGTLNDGSVEVLAGDNVAWTGSSWDKLTMDLSVYDDKFIAAGFFEVQNYNDTTGEITFVYASDLYDMSYNGDTGVLTIEAN